VDLKRIRRSLFYQPEFTINGVKYDTNRLEQNGPRAVDLLANHNYPNGELLAAVNFQLDMSTHAVPRADLASGPPIDDKAIDTFAARVCAWRMPRNEPAPRCRTEPRRLVLLVVISSRASMG
jgi:hypothetical protein